MYTEQNLNDVVSDMPGFLGLVEIELLHSVP